MCISWSSWAFMKSPKDGAGVFECDTMVLSSFRSIPRILASDFFFKCGGMNHLREKWGGKNRVVRFVGDKLCYVCRRNAKSFWIAVLSLNGSIQTLLTSVIIL